MNESVSDRLRGRLRGAVLLVVLALAMSAFLVSCGGEEEEPSTADSEPAETRPDGGGNSKQVVIEAANGAFDSQTIFERDAPGVVTVISVFGGQATGILGGGGGAGQGSGFVISEGGEIVTNAHVVTDAAQAGGGGGSINPAEEVYVQFADANQVEAEIIGFDPFADIALLEVDPDGLDLHPLPLGSEADVEVGAPVAAIGSPFGQDQSLSVGIVSATDRSIESLTKFRIEGAIQTDASINPGNSGGPLLSAEGEVIGINQQINTTSGGNEGVGFAVPIDLAESSIDELRKDGEPSYAYAGVSTTALYPQLADRLGLDVDHGALVSEVVNNGPADEAGLEGSDSVIEFQGNPEVPEGGDLITAVDGEEIRDAGDLPRIIALLDPGDEVTLDIIRDGDEQQIDLTLGERPVSGR